MPVGHYLWVAVDEFEIELAKCFYCVYYLLSSIRSFLSVETVPSFRRCSFLAAVQGADLCFWGKASHDLLFSK